MISSARQHRLERQHVALRRSVLERAGPAGAFRNVAAERRLPEACRIGRIEKADLLDGVLQIAGDDVRLHARQQVHLIDFQNAIHPLERQHDSAAGRHRAAGIAGAGAAGHERHTLVVAQLRDLRHFSRRAGKDDDIRSGALLRAVRAVGVSRRHVLKHERAADNAGGPRGEARRKSGHTIGRLRPCARAS